MIQHPVLAWLPALSGVVALCELCRGLPWTRRLLQEGMQWLVRLDLAAVRLLRRLRPPRYELVGACQRRGDCCTQIVAEPPRVMLRSPKVLGAFVAMHRLLHNFHLVSRGPLGQLIFRCGFLQTDGKCGIYRYRPRLCRTYPLLPFFAAPKLLPGCGYRVKLRGLQGSARLPVVNAHVGLHHPTPPRRPAEGVLEYPQDFRLVDVRPRENGKESPFR